MDDRSHPIPLHLLFQWECWRASFFASKRDLSDNTQAVATVWKRARDAKVHWLGQHVRYNPVYLAGVDAQVESTVLPAGPNGTMPDGFAELINKEKSKAQAVDRYRNYRVDPWTCGGTIYVSAITMSASIHRV